MIKVEHHDNGNIKRITIRNKKDRLHNREGPALQIWYENGQEQNREYLIDGMLNNPIGPALQEWYENGREKRREYWLLGKQLIKKCGLEQKDTVEITVEGKTKRISRESAKALNLI